MVGEAGDLTDAVVVDPVVGDVRLIGEGAEHEGELLDVSIGSAKLIDMNRRDIFLSASSSAAYLAGLAEPMSGVIFRISSTNVGWFHLSVGCREACPHHSGTLDMAIPAPARGRFTLGAGHANVSANLHGGNDAPS